MKIAALRKFTLSDYPGKIAAIIFTQGCNFRCPYCHNPSLLDIAAPSPLTEDEIFSFLEKRKGKLDGIVISGGEPTLQPDLLPFMKKLKGMGFSVKLDTNGSNPELLKKALEQNLIDYIAFDNKAPLAKYQQIVRSDVDPAFIKESMEMVKNSAVAYEFRTTVVKSQLSPQDLIECAKQIVGAETLILQKFVPDHALEQAFRTESSYPEEEFKVICEELGQYVKNCMLR